MTSLYRAMWIDKTTDDQQDRVELARECFARWALSSSNADSLPDGEVRTSRDASESGDEVGTRIVNVWSVEPPSGPGFMARTRDLPIPSHADQTTWTVEARVLGVEEGVRVSVELTMETSDPTLRIAVGRPSLVDDLLAFSENPVLGGSAILSDVLDFDAGTVPELIRYLRDPERTLPAIVFSAPGGADDVRWRRLADRTLTRARGVTSVMRLDASAVTAFRQTLGDLAVWGGGVRTYNPAPLDSDADRWRHRYISGIRVREAESRTVDNLVLSVSSLSARRRTFDELANMSLRGRSSRHHSLEDNAGRQDELEFGIDQEREDRAQVESELMLVTGHLERLQVRLRDRGLEELFWEAHDAASEDMPNAVDTVSDAVTAAQLYLSHALVIPDTARRNLEGIDTAANASAWGNTAWRGFRALALYVEGRQGGFEGNFWDWCAKSGHPLAWPASSKKLSMVESSTVTSNKKFMKARLFDIDAGVVENGKLNMVAHLKISEGGGDLAPRVYFYDDAVGETGKVHVGFVGPHYLVPNTKS